MRAVLGVGEGRRGEGKGSWGRESRRGLLRKKWEVDMGAEFTPPSVGIVLGAEVLMHVPFFGSLKCRKVMELSTIKRTSGSSALRSHSSGYLHTQEEH